MNDAPIGGIGEGFDETDDRMVFNTNKPVSELAEAASRRWIATFLLGMPTI